MSQRIILAIIYIITLIFYFILNNPIIKISLLLVVSSILFFYIIKKLSNEKSSLVIPIINMIILVLLIMTFLYPPFTITKEITSGEYVSFGKTKENDFKKLNGKLMIIDNNGVEFIKFKDDSSFLIKKEYKKNIKINNLQVEILSKSKYLTGNYILYIKNNLTNENQEYVISNSGNIDFGNGIKIKMLNKSNDFKNSGKAIQISYTFPQSKRSHKQWLYKDYKEFNLITGSDDPLTIVYVGDEAKNIYHIKISFIPPYQKIISYLIILLSLVFLILNLLKIKDKIKEEKNEN